MNEDQYATGKPEMPTPQSLSLKAANALHGLLNQLEDKLTPVMRPALGLKENVTPPVEQQKSELMQELGYLQSRMNSLIERLHV